MSVYVGRDSRVVIQGITGQHATFHAEEAMSFGTPIVGGVTPGKGGSTHLGLPVFNSVEEGRTILTESGLAVIQAADLDDAAAKAVAAVAEVAA